MYDWFVWFLVFMDGPGHALDFTMSSTPLEDGQAKAAACIKSETTVDR